MGERGPRSQSEQMKNRKGNPGKRKPKVDKNASLALEKRPRVPCFLVGNKIAAAEWRRVSKEYVAMGKLTKINLKALEAYCLNYAIWRDAQNDIAESGQVLKAPNGCQMPNPSIAIANKAQKEMRDWLKVLENTKAQVAKKEQSPLQQFIDKKRGLRRVK